ncbi:MAG: acyl-CoA dehydrogenase [Pseudomonadota bacterium]
MAEKFVSKRNLDFLLYEVLGIEALTRIPYFADHSRETFDLVLETAIKMGRDLIYPLYREMDQKPPEYVDGQAKVHPKVRAYLKEAGDGGWIAAGFPYEFEGQQLPVTLLMATTYIFNAANFSANAYPGLTTGAAHLLISFADENLQQTYLPNMLSGQWQGTMALTEPQAGSSLSDVVTTAEPTDKGYYKIRGQKIFISAGDHDGVDNVVHLMLAKIKGAPPGVKGISLLVVPKLRPNQAGGLESNDVNLAGIYHKLGYRGCPITQLSIGENDDCRGWLVGEPNQGLRYMFQMMNESRLGVGMQATAIASAAYYESLAYARERSQGRDIAAKDPSAPQIPIIQHADIKRMLLFQRAVMEGSLSLILQCSQYDDLQRGAEGQDKERYELLLDLLTPVAKSYPSETGILSVSQGLQILGGYGYCDEFPLEQHYRDMRIHPIHEGTTGMQGLDLLGRKAIMKNGRALAYYLEETARAVKEAREFEVLQPYAARLEATLQRLQEVTGHLVGFALQGDVRRFLADATLYLEFFGIIAIAWQWLRQGQAAARALVQGPSETDKKFYQGKLAAMKYFFHYELPKTLGLSARLMEADGLTAGLDAELFSD